jgi:hypothetical protein
MRYAIWNKKDPVITPVGKVYTARQWIDRWPLADLPNIVPVVAAGEINGAYFGTLGQMVQQAEAQGCDFSGCTTDEEKLAVIEAFEDAQNVPNDVVSNEDMNAASLASIAASLEYQNMLTLDDEEEV